MWALVLAGATLPLEAQGVLPPSTRSATPSSGAPVPNKGNGSDVVVLRGGVVMPLLGLGSSGGCHPDPDGTEKKCGNYNATLQAIGLGYRAFHDALSYVSCRRAAAGHAVFSCVAVIPVRSESPPWTVMVMMRTMVMTR